MRNFINKKWPILFIMLPLLFVASCKKYLDEKPSKSLVVPNSLKDLQALLDNNSIMNTLNTGLGEASADNYYLTDANWSALDDAGRNTYIWGDEVTFESRINTWQYLYIPIFNANTVLHAVEKVNRNSANDQSWKNIKGSALFYRARSFLVLTTTWAKAYDPSTAKQDLGVPIRIDTDFNIASVRSSVEDSYLQIIKDLKESVNLLPDLPIHSMRPSKSAAYALLSRTYLVMRQYQQAEEYADLCLQISDVLLDYNDLNASATYPIAAFNKEVIFNTNGTVLAIGVTRAKIDPDLYLSYQSNDLRKQIFFLKNSDGSFRFKGSYFGSSSLFTGIANDELYLTKAECLARRGKVQESMDILNKLMVKRFDKKTFSIFSATSEAGALNIILIERRKELLMRDIRWLDLKRLNKEPENQVLIKRTVNGQVYELKPNENRYALPIPNSVIQLTGMQQNPR